MSAEYRTLEPLPFCSLDKRLEEHGITVEMGAKVTKLTVPNGVLFARPEGDSTHFECRFGVDALTILEVIEKEYGITILDEDDPRFWGFSSWDDMRQQREALKQRNILIEGPLIRNARFAVAWLSSAIELDQKWNERWNAPLMMLIGTFEASAMEFAKQWLAGNGVFSVNLRQNAMAETLLVMIELGFFTLTGNRYQMTLPDPITTADVRRALFRMIEIQDQHELADLENLFSILSEAEAQGWIDRISNMDSDERLTDRNLLLLK
jgi:hypothetical protein